MYKEGLCETKHYIRYWVLHTNGKVEENKVEKKQERGKEKKTPEGRKTKKDKVERVRRIERNYVGSESRKYQTKIRREE